MLNISKHKHTIAIVAMIISIILAIVLAIFSSSTGGSGLEIASAIIGSLITGALIAAFIEIYGSAVSRADSKIDEE